MLCGLRGFVDAGTEAFVAAVVAPQGQQPPLVAVGYLWADTTVVRVEPSQSCEALADQRSEPGSKP